MKELPAKRVQIVSVKLVRESSVLFQKRVIGNSKDLHELIQPMFKGVER